jgi:parallel beta-helix repeat protein
MKKSLIGQILFVTILLSLWVGSTTAVTVINDCNFNANITGVYYVLGQNLTCNGSEHGINIGASNITIDGYNETDYKHYWIDGGSPAGCDPFTTYWSGIYDEGGYDHVTIRNLEILHFCNGIFLRDTALNENYTIENCKVHDIGTGPGTQGINLKMLNHGTVKSCEIYNVDGTGSGCESGGDGIFLYDGRNNTFTCNNIHHNRKGGIFIKMMPKYTNISRNHLWKNGQAGAGETGGIILRCMLCNYNLIAFNNASNNYGDGIFIGGLYNTIEYNLVINNSDNGIDIGRNDGGDCNELYSNTVCNNGGKDIRTCGGTDPSSGCYGNTGNENTCDTTENYADEGATGCLLCTFCIRYR